MPIPGSTGVLRHEDCFATDTISTASADGIAWVVLGDSGDTVFARAVAAARGLHVAGATAATDDNMIEFCGDQLMFYGQTGHSAIEMLVMLDVVTNIAFNFGFNDDVLDAGNTLPIELSGTTWTTTSSTFMGFVFDTDATNDELHAMWVDDDNDATNAIADLRFNGIAPTANEWLYMKVEMDDRGSGNAVKGTFLAVDSQGRSAEKHFTTTVDRDAALCFYFGVENRSASAHNVYLRLPAWEQGL